MTKKFLLEALKHEQHTIMFYLNESKRDNFPDVWWLDYALETVITTYRDLRDGRIDMQTAFDYYKQVTRITTDFSGAFLDYLYDERMHRREQAINDTLLNLYQRGLIVKDGDGYWDWIPGGREQVFGSAA